MVEGFYRQESKLHRKCIYSRGKVNQSLRNSILLSLLIGLTASSPVFALEISAGRGVHGKNASTANGKPLVKTGVKSKVSPASTAVAGKSLNKTPRPQAVRNVDLASTKSKPTAASAETTTISYPPTIAARIKDYRSAPSTASWEFVLKELLDYAQQPNTARLSQTALLQVNPALADLGTKIIDFAGGRIWNFTKAPECQHLVVQWQNVSPGIEETVTVRGRRRIVRSAPQVSWRAELIHVPAGLKIKEARIVSSSSLVTVGKRVIRTDSPHSLVLIGADRGGNNYLHAFRASGSVWNEVQDIFSGVPPYVLQNLTGKASFSGNDLVLAIGGAGANEGADKKTSTITASNGYRIVLKLNAGKYLLDGGKNGEDSALSIVAQFASALQQNRLDLAKAWLADPKLVSIPKYIGYLGKSSPPARIIPMNNPGNGSSRFRLITSMKDDLIIDVGKTKTLPFAIKALFIAPPDPMAARILSNLQSHDPPAANAATQDDSGNQ